MEAKEILEKAKLNWMVSKEPLQTVSEGILIPSTFALIRQDTKALLGTCGKGYEIYQNDELLDLLFKISTKTGLQMHSGGCLNGGKNVWFQLKSDNYKLPGGDKLEAFLSGLNSFNKTKCLAFGNSFITVSCLNTWHKAYMEVETKLRHSISMRPKIEEILKSIEILMVEEKHTHEEVVRLSEFEMDAETELMVLQKLFDLAAEESIEDLSKQKQDKIHTYWDALALETAQKGDNLWGLFSGVTRYTTHSLKKTEEETMASKMFGESNNKERSIYRELSLMVS